MRLLNLIVLFLALAVLRLMAQTTPAEPPAGNIAGIVTSTAGGKPLAGVSVSTSAGPRQFRAVTDDRGHYVLRGVPPGKYRVEARGPSSGWKTVALGPGEELAHVDFRLLGPAGTVSGKISDEEGNPLEGMLVTLMARLYNSGTADYWPVSSGRTNARGEYHLKASPATDRYLAMVKTAAPILEDAPAESGEPELRGPVPMTTVYPRSRSLAGGVPIVVPPGESREGLDIRMLRSLSYCIEGKAEAPGKPDPPFLRIMEAEPPAAIISATPVESSQIRPRRDGSFRICGLPSGEYLLTAFAGELSGALLVTVDNQDVRDIRLIAHDGVTISGTAAWDGNAPENGVDARVSVELGSWGRGLRLGARDAPLPGAFTLSGLDGAGIPAIDNFEFRVAALPKGTYLKDIIYGGVSVMGKRLRAGSLVAGAELRIVISPDGGSLVATVLDRSGKPVPECYVTMVSATARSEADLSVDLRSGRTDEMGAYAFVGLKPGKYLVLASATEFNTSEVSLVELGRMLMRATAVEIPVRGAAQVKLEPVTVD